MRKIVIFLFIMAVIALLAAWFISQNKEKFLTPPTLSKNEIFDLSKNAYISSSTNITFSPFKSASEQTSYGTLQGQETTASIESSEATVAPFENTTLLQKDGYVQDPNLAASGPGSNVWGYKQTLNGKTKVVIFSYQTQPTSSNPNEPLQFNCPCKVDLKVFVSDPFDEKQ